MPPENCCFDGDWLPWRIEDGRTVLAWYGLYRKCCTDQVAFVPDLLPRPAYRFGARGGTYQIDLRDLDAKRPA